MERGSGAQIDGADWAERLRGASIGNAMINELVMDYLVIEGHKEAATAFAAETGTSGAPAEIYPAFICTVHLIRTLVRSPASWRRPRDSRR